MNKNLVRILFTVAQFLVYFSLVYTYIAYYFIKRKIIYLLTPIRSFSDKFIIYTYRACYFIKQEIDYLLTPIRNTSNKFIIWYTTRGKTLCKVLNSKECHHGFQYKPGLNVLQEEFNDDIYITCGNGGLYFTTLENAHWFERWGDHTRKVTLPWFNPKFKIIMCPYERKFRANMIILGEEIKKSKK